MRPTFLRKTDQRRGEIPRILVIQLWPLALIAAIAFAGLLVFT